jgi:hypothetical protein
LIFLDPQEKRYYLHALNCWLISDAINGQWTPTTTVPVGADAVKDQLSKDKTIDLLDPADADAAPKELPTIYTSTTPAELVQLRGEPEYSPIQGTALLYVKNTDSALFMFLTSQQNYLLVSGRWFTAASVDGPWKFVSGKDLPANFAKIPADSPKANVLVSVPGTDQAREAIIANSIPQTATVTIADAHLAVVYDGAPRFATIDGAQGLSYAQNTPLPVISVASDRTFWCVQNGIWFRATAAAGPWIVATTVPGIIYTIPVSCPIHYVTYVKVYGHTATVVYVGYTSGYMGTCVSSDGVVVYGMGYYYPAYVQTVWVGYPTTYGYGASFACGAATGFAFGFAAGAILGDCWSHPYGDPAGDTPTSILIRPASIRTGAAASLIPIAVTAITAQPVNPGPAAADALSIPTPVDLPLAGTPDTSIAKAVISMPPAAAQPTTPTPESFAPVERAFTATPTTAMRMSIRGTVFTTRALTPAWRRTTIMFTRAMTETSTDTTRTRAGKNTPTTAGRHPSSRTSHFPPNNQI